MRWIFTSSVAAIVLVSGLLVSRTVDAQPGPSCAVPTTEFMQKQFVIATWWDPPIQFLPNHASFKQDVLSFRMAKAAHFNLLTATQISPRTAGGVFSPEEMEYRLDLAANAGLMSLVNDEREMFGAYPPFNVDNAFMITNQYACRAEDDPKRIATYGYLTWHEPCLNETLDPGGSFCETSGRGETNVNDYRDWIQHYKTYDPEKLAFVLLLPYEAQGTYLYEEYLDTSLIPLRPGAQNVVAARAGPW